jgi:hypothetical protein
MRTMRIAVVLCGVVVTRTAAAQTAAPPVVQMDNAATGQPAAAPAPPPPAAPAGPVAAPAEVLTAANTSASVGGAASSSDWKFDYHGYFRAPLRIGVGTNATNPGMPPPPGQSTTAIHNPIVPDDQYLSWQYTSVQSKDWAELFLSYGNSWAKGTVGLQGFQFTDAAWAQASAQFGISQGWITLTPSLGYQNVRAEFKVGSFWGKYGMAGEYDAGKYDTFLFGRTHVMGESGRIEIDVGKVTLWAEEGFGGKQPDPNPYNATNFTLLAHGHAGLKWDRMLAVSAHFLYSWAQDSDQSGANFKDLPAGSMTVSGLDASLSNTLIGRLYAGYSHVGCNTCSTVTDAVEVIHSQGGNVFSGGIQANYLDSVAPSGTTNGPSHGNGAVDTFLLQYDFSLANLLAQVKTPKQDYYGDGPDLRATYFMMYNAVTSEDPVANGEKKLKYGVDLLGLPVKWLGIGVRYDRVQPNNKIPEQSFGLISPRLTFHSAFLTHEEITLQYSHYMYNQQACPLTNATLCVQPPPGPNQPNGFGATTGNNPIETPTTNQRAAPVGVLPDANVFKLQASMWW